MKKFISIAAITIVLAIGLLLSSPAKAITCHKECQIECSWDGKCHQVCHEVCP